MTAHSKTRVIGPLAAHVEGLCEELAAAGYKPVSQVSHRRVLADLSHWLVQEGLDPAELDSEAVARFLAHRQSTGAHLWVTTRGITPMLDYLRLVGAVPALAADDEDAIGTVLVAYRRYMSSQRLLATLTIASNSGTARRFLVAYGEAGFLDLAGLSAGAVNTYIVREAEHLRTASVAAMATSLRDFVRFLYATGVVPRDLSGAIPGVKSARLASLPKGLDPSVVTLLLDSCDRRQPGGLRDYAILKLLVRLGLRAIEVSSMLLDDIDWRAGEFTVHGKGQRQDRLPLPVDVGEALADYLANGRPKADSRAVFLRGMAPLEPISRNAVVFVPRSACLRVGIPVLGAHRLRHTAATEMLSHGASLREIAQVLRHESEQTTAIYAKVHRSALEQAVSPWPVAP